MSKLNDQNFQTVRRFVIVQMKKVEATPLSTARVLRDLSRLAPVQLAAIADAIKSKEYRDADLNHDIYGVLYEDLKYFVPRIKVIAEVF